MDSLRHNRLVIVGLLSLAALASVRILLLEVPDPYRPLIDRTQQSDDPAPRADAGGAVDRALEEEFVSRTAMSLGAMSADLARLLEREEHGLLRERLLDRAASAVSAGDQRGLGHVMSLLGQLSIEQNDLDSAEVFLLEALDVYQRLADEVGAAQVYMQLGRAHLRSRQIARSAGDSYDRLLVARWQLSRGRYGVAEHNFRKVVEESLPLNRFGTAASAYHSLARLYSESGNAFDAEQSAMEAAKLYAASGQPRRAASAVEVLRKAGVEGWRLDEIERTIARNYEQFQASVRQIERARDYRQLYHHYRRKGDHERAWKLRLMANESLRNVSRRAMFHRQPDALALLYVSNDDRGRAENYFEIARKTFDSKGLDDLSTQVSRLVQQIH